MKVSIFISRVQHELKVLYDMIYKRRKKLYKAIFGKHLDPVKYMCPHYI